MKEEMQALSEFLKNMDFLRLTNDFAFKAYFTKNEALLKSLIKNFLPLPKDATIVGIDLLNPELSAEKSSSKPGKTFVLDLRAKFVRESSLKRESEIVNIEIQSTRQTYFTDRILAYSGRLYSEQLSKGDGYEKLVPVYSLVFTTQNLSDFKDVTDDYRHVCNIRRTKDPQVVMSRGMCFVIVELGKFTKDMEKLDNTRDDWSFILKNSEELGVNEYQTFLNKGGEMAEAVKRLWDLSQDDLLREEAWALEKQRKDRFAERQFEREEARSKGLAEGLAEGRAEGHTKGRSEGLTEGHTKGRSEGLTEGHTKGRSEGLTEGCRKIALDMLKDGCNSKMICKYTGLSQKEVEDLKNSRR